MRVLLYGVFWLVVLSSSQCVAGQLDKVSAESIEIVPQGYFSVRCQTADLDDAAVLVDQIKRSKLTLRVEGVDTLAELDSFRELEMEATEMAPVYELTFVALLDSDSRQNAWRAVSRSVDMLSMAPAARVTLVGENGETWAESESGRIEYLTRADLIPLVLVLAVIIFVAVGYRMLLKPAPPGGSPADGLVSSLSSNMVFLWTLVVGFAFLYAWLTVGTLSIPSSVLALLGITVGTATLSKLIPTTSKTRSGIMRLLEGENGQSTLSRAQALMWNLVIMVVFLWLLLSERAIPELDETLLVLMGVSNGTYVGAKSLAHVGLTKVW